MTTLTLGTRPKLRPDLAPIHLRFHDREPGLACFRLERPTRVLGDVRRITEREESQLPPERHTPVPVLGGHANEPARRAGALLEAPVEAHAVLEMLHDVRCDDDIEPPVGNV